MLVVTLVVTSAVLRAMCNGVAVLPAERPDATAPQQSCDVKNVARCCGSLHSALAVADRGCCGCWWRVNQKLCSACFLYNEKGLHEGLRQAVRITYAAAAWHVRPVCCDVVITSAASCQAVLPALCMQQHPTICVVFWWCMFYHNIWG